MADPHNQRGAEDLERFRKVSRWLDSNYRVPGTNWTFGWDPLLGLIPGAGDVLSYLISSVMVLIMVRNGVSGRVATLMILNLGLDALIGSIPILGSIFDFVNKANKRNVRLLEKHYKEGKHKGSVLSVIIPMVLFILLMTALLIWGIVWIISSITS